jgi:predicted O-methyltransferase YrrM
MLNRIITKIKTFNNFINNAEYVKKLQIDTYCNTLLHNLQKDTYLPRTGMSLRPYALSYLLNEITINNRTNIIEFGSGISTIFMARLAFKNKIELKILSVDDDDNWINKLNEILSKENLTKYVQFVHAPLKLNDNNYEWYNENIIDKSYNNQKFDLVLIDGPKAYPKGKSQIRYGALPYIYQKLKNEFIVFLDDANREGEDQIIKKWQAEFGLKFNIEKNLAIAIKGNYFFSNPI